MDHIQRGLRVSVFVFIAVVVGFPAAAGEIVSVQAGGSGVTWHPLVPFEHGVLTVAGPDGRVFREEFGAGGGIQFSPFAQPGYYPPDGTYIWEVWLGQPSAVNPKVRAAAHAARESGDVDAEAAHRFAVTQTTQNQSGAFQILNGAIVPSNLVEPRVAPRGSGPRSGAPDPFRQAAWLLDDPSIRQVDQVIPDDLIVQGSLCVGLDCVNNESFGFDTIRLKENNTRIKFDDTSTAAGFPANDWQLTANDSASGGSSKFSIEDITGAKVPFTVRAGAATNSIFVDSTGRVGFRTATPVLDLHMNTSNTPATRLEQNNTGGFTAQTWDIAGTEANFFVRDVTGGSRLPFRIRPGAPTSSIDIAASGNVGIGTAAPGAALDVTSALGSTQIAGNLVQHIYNAEANPRWQINRDLSGSGQAGIAFNIDGTGSLATKGSGISGVASRTLGLFTSNGTALTERVRIDSSGNVGIGTTGPTHQLQLSIDDAAKPTTNTWTITSDARVKTVQRSFLDGLSVIRRIDPVWFRYNGRGGFVDDDEHVGVLAQSLLPVAPYMIGTNRRVLDPGGKPTDVYTYQGHALAFVTVNAVKELDAEIATLRARIADRAMTIDGSGNVGIGMTTPTRPLEMASGAFVSAGGVWTDASSRTLKEDIRDLTVGEAQIALNQLAPVRYTSKADPTEHHVGFIAEDVPDLVATKDRTALSPMDIVAVLTRVVQEQQKTIAELASKLEALEAARAR